MTVARFQSRRRAFTFFLLAGAAMHAWHGPSARAAGRFDMRTFLDAQVDGRPILVSVHADWCPACKKQKRVVDALATEKRFAGVTFLDVDYDNEPAILKRLRVAQQSTLIAFRGNREIGRLVFDADPSAIRRLVEGAL